MKIDKPEIVPSRNFLKTQKNYYFCNMKTVKEIETTLRESKPYLYEKYPIKSLAIFGSYARNEQNDHSDLDLLVEFNDKIGIRFIDLADELEQLLGFKVDLVSKRGIKQKYMEVIQSQLIYV